MRDDAPIHILPYTYIVGQKGLKLALELAYIAPRIGGVLISGERGTGKSTIARAFAQMMYGKLPVTIPINATEDRVVGGWNIDALMRSEPRWQTGLLEEANGTLLYVDEVNLLDDHIINIILDVTSTGVLVVQRDGSNTPPKPIDFTLVGTMNPEEGSLRPQLLDRFGLLVNVTAEASEDVRNEILQAVLAFDKAMFNIRNGQGETFFENATEGVKHCRAELEQAHRDFYSVEIPEKPVDIAKTCVTLAKAFHAEGHRGDYVLLLAARAYAARKKEKLVKPEHVKTVAPMALQHRRPGTIQLNTTLWTKEDDSLLAELLDHV